MVRRTFPHLALAFVGMGTWAMIANHAHPWPSVIAAGLLQGSLSASLTLVMKRLIEAVVRRSEPVVARIAAPLTCGLLSASVLTSLHRLAGTPEVAATVAVPVVVSTLYAATYALALTRLGTDR